MANHQRNARNGGNNNWQHESRDEQGGYDRDQDYDRWSSRSQEDRYSNDRDRGKYEADYGFPQPGDRGSRWNESGRGREYIRGGRDAGYGGQDMQRDYGSRYAMGYDTDPYGGSGRSDRGGTQGYRMRNENWQPERGPHSGKGPKGYKRSDARIEEDVNEALSRDAAIDASDIEVAIKDGDVTLTGTVPERSMKWRAEDCAEQCSGVHQVQNNVHVAHADAKAGNSGDAARNSKAGESGKHTGNASVAAGSHANSTSGSTSRQQSSRSTQ